MTFSVTRTSTYTKVDIGKTLESFRSVLRMISLSSRCDVELVDNRANDILEYAYARYLAGVDIILRDASGERVRVARFTVSEDATSWHSDLPGDNIWPVTDGGSITLVARTTTFWQQLSEDRKRTFRSGLKLSWGTSKEDTNFADMELVGSRRYASNSYGLEQTTLRKKGRP